MRFFKHLKDCQTINEQRCNCEHHVTLHSRLKWPLADYGQKPFVKIIVAIVKEGHWKKVIVRNDQISRRIFSSNRRVYFFEIIFPYFFERKRKVAKRKNIEVYSTVYYAITYLWVIKSVSLNRQILFVIEEVYNYDYTLYISFYKARNS